MISIGRKLATRLLGDYFTNFNSIPRLNNNFAHRSRLPRWRANCSGWICIRGRSPHMRGECLRYPHNESVGVSVKARDRAQPLPYPRIYLFHLYSRHLSFSNSTHPLSFLFLSFFPRNQSSFSHRHFYSIVTRTPPQADRSSKQR